MLKRNKVKNISMRNSNTCANNENLKGQKNPDSFMTYSCSFNKYFPSIYYITSYCSEDSECISEQKKTRSTSLVEVIF